MMPTPLQLTQRAFGRHLALEVLDRTFDSSVTDLHLERAALH